MAPLVLDPDRLFPGDPGQRSVARRLYELVADLAIVSPHGHLDATLIADNGAFDDPASALVVPDHYLTRLLHSRGVPLADLGVGAEPGAFDPRRSWRAFCENWQALAGTSTRLWLEHQFVDLFEIEDRPSVESADRIYDQIADAFGKPDFRPRALFERMQIEALATTETPLSDLAAHQALESEVDWSRKVIPAFRPDELVDLASPKWPDRIASLGELSECETGSYRGFLSALEKRRNDFIELGATSTDHGHATARAVELDASEAERIYALARAGRATNEETEAFRSHMLCEFARMSCEDGLVMQLHTGVWRNYDIATFAQFGPDVGADIPTRSDLVASLHHLLNRFGSDVGFKLVIYTVDESTWSRELAPLAGFYPSVYIGAPWWFLDAPDSIRRFRESTTEIAGLSNYAGFVDDARVLTSIRARHDVARRVDCGYLAKLVVEDRLSEDEASLIAPDLAFGCAKRVFRM
ncbi:MAG TPA: glucuronate isomerase [Acidimicrobiales bacterium]|nr:glucuronate isomerase [Acidimicrobiales bacterium]